MTRARKVKAIKTLREWERLNLPTYGTEAGYDLVLVMASLEAEESISLKKLYLSIRFAESTIRLLIRNLEQDGSDYTNPISMDAIESFVARRSSIKKLLIG
jgi:hypothetical protein